MKNTKSIAGTWVVKSEFNLYLASEQYWGEPLYTSSRERAKRYSSKSQARRAAKTCSCKVFRLRTRRSSWNK